MTQINLLPWRQLQREQRKRRFFIHLSGYAAITLLLLLLWHMNLAARLHHQEGRKQYLQQRVTVLSDQLKKLDNLQKQKAQLLTRMTIIQQLQADRPIMVHVFDELPRLLPNGVYLTRMQAQDNSITLQGKSQSNTLISSFMRNLEGSKWLTQPVLQEIKDAAESDSAFGDEFTLQVLIQRPASFKQGNNHEA